MVGTYKVALLIAAHEGRNVATERHYSLNRTHASISSTVTKSITPMRKRVRLDCATRGLYARGTCLMSVFDDDDNNDNVGDAHYDDRNGDDNDL